MIKAQSAGCSDIGKVRRANEDSYLINDTMGLYVVADGMGGHRAGDVASRMAIEAIDQYMTAPSLPAEDLGSDRQGAANNDKANRLIHSIRLANQQIHSRSASDQTYRGMGTTVSALCLSENTIITANVGDSPIYLVRNREIEQLYTPHTLLHERQKIPKSMAGLSSAKLGHILTRAVGIRSQVNVDFVETPCFEDDIVILCSDGLSNKINQDEIRDLVNQNDIENACKMMTDSANQRGGEDNITVIIVRMISSKNNSAPTLRSRITNIPQKVASLLGFGKRS